MPRRLPIGPFPKGMDNRSDETAVPAETAREIKNYDVDRDGNLERRRPVKQLLSGSTFHSLYSAKSGNLYGCVESALGIFDIYGKTFTPLIQMEDAYKTDFVELNGHTYAFNPSFSCRFPEGGKEVRTVGVPLIDTTPSMFTVVPDAGGLHEGEYTVALSVVDDKGEESGLSPEHTLSVPQGGGISVVGLPLIPGNSLRLYCTTRNGEELYQVWEGPMTAVSLSIDQSMILTGGRQPETKHLQPMPKGQFVDYLASRLLVASGDTVFFSDSFRPHLTRLEHNFVKFNGIIRLLKATHSGVYVGDASGVYFLTGRDPSKWTVEGAAHLPAVYGSGLKVAAEHFGREFKDEDHVVTWLSQTGLSLGGENGDVTELHPGQLDLPAYKHANACFVDHNGRKQIVVPVSSSDWLGTGTALDSSIQ